MKHVLPLRECSTSAHVERLLPAVPVALLHLEIELLYDCKLFAQGDFDCYLAEATRMPNLLREIARLREQTFREVGEGTGKSSDTDAYDAYYHHLFLWDRTARRVVGAYRIGMGADIMREHGRKGFYTNTLFSMDRKLSPVLEQSVELGRSFIRRAYQKHRLPLFMLWQGILSVLVGSQEHRYVLGPVSISSYYQELSKKLMVEFIRRNYFNHALAMYVKAKHPFEVEYDNPDDALLLHASEDDLRKLDKIIAEIEPSSYTVPVLLKKYLQQNARIIGFNLDPKFSNALDGLMILDLQDIPAKTIQNLQRGLAHSATV